MKALQKITIVKQQLPTIINDTIKINAKLKKGNKK